MADKQVAYIGSNIFQKYEASHTSKSITKNRGGGCTSKITESHSAGGFVDRRSGNQGFKEQVKYESSVKVNDKLNGTTTEYQSEVKCSKTTTYHSQNKGSGGKSGGSKSSGGISGGSKSSGSISGTGGKSGGSKSSGGKSGGSKSSGGKSGGRKSSGGKSVEHYCLTAIVESPP